MRRPVINYLAAFSNGPVPLTRSPEERIKFLPLLQEILRSNPLFCEIIVSFDNGEIFSAKLLETEEERRSTLGPSAPPS